jgi:hypothetical protein
MNLIVRMNLIVFSLIGFTKPHSIINATFKGNFPLKIKHQPGRLKINMITEFLLLISNIHLNYKVPDMLYIQEFLYKIRSKTIGIAF